MRTTHVSPATAAPPEPCAVTGGGTPRLHAEWPSPWRGTKPPPHRSLASLSFLPSFVPSFFLALSVLRLSPMMAACPNWLPIAQPPADTPRSARRHAIACDCKQHPSMSSAAVALTKDDPQQPRHVLLRRTCLPRRRAATTKSGQSHADRTVLRRCMSHPPPHRAASKLSAVRQSIAGMDLTSMSRCFVVFPAVASATCATPAATRAQSARNRAATSEVV